jgi:prolyl oligopeptidase
MKPCSLRLRSLCLLSGVVLAASVRALAALPAAPEAKTLPVEDTYFGTKVTDPYRWMEDSKSPEFQAYLKAQSGRTRAILDSIPGRKAMESRVEALMETITSSANVNRRRSLFFYEKLQPGSNLSRLYVRDGLGGAERLLLDPATLSHDGHHQAISYYLPSDDGATVAVGLSAGGSENAVMHFLDAASGKELKETIDRTDFGATAWRADGRALYYMRRQALAAGAAPTAKYENIRTYLHVLGTNPEKDVAVFGIGISANVTVGKDDFAAAGVSPDSDYALGVVIHGVRNEQTIYVARKAELDSGAAAWKKVADVDDEVTDVENHGNELYLLCHKDALRYKVLETSAENPDVAHARVVIAPSARVIEHMGAAKDALYVQSTEDGLGRVTRVDWSGNRTEIRLPLDGTVGSLTTAFDDPGFLAKIESWTVSPLWYAYDPAAGAVSDTRLDPPSAVDYSGVVAEEVKVPASDGALVPLSIVHRKDMAKDGSHPTLLYAYGSYGITSNASFSPVRLAWLERGGVFAVAHVRGGGEYGEEWHLAGKDANKVKTVSDYIACGRWLVAKGYTSPEKLGGRGGSAGGITMGGAITQAPELFAAILDEVPVSDQLRIETSPNGPPNIPEFGSVTTEQGFRNLYATSAFHHVKAGARYPAVMLTTGANDPRVDPWQAAKMAATLQAATSSGKPILLRVDYEGGHGGIGGTKHQAAIMAADEYTFLLWNTGDPAFQPAL